MAMRGRSVRLRLGIADEVPMSVGFSQAEDGVDHVVPKSGIQLNLSREAELWGRWEHSPRSRR